MYQSVSVSMLWNQTIHHPCSSLSFAIHALLESLLNLGFFFVIQVEKYCLIAHRLRELNETTVKLSDFTQCHQLLILIATTMAQFHGITNPLSYRRNRSGIQTMGRHSQTGVVQVPESQENCNRCEVYGVKWKY